jgi:hypothetical protein
MAGSTLRPYLRLCRAASYLPFSTRSSEEPTSSHISRSAYSGEVEHWFLSKRFKLYLSVFAFSISSTGKRSHGKKISASRSRPNASQQTSLARFRAEIHSPIGAAQITNLVFNVSLFVWAVGVAEFRLETAAPSKAHRRLGQRSLAVFLDMYDGGTQNLLT